MIRISRFGALVEHKGLSATVTHIDTMLSLQRTGRAHHASFAAQQKMMALSMDEAEKDMRGAADFLAARGLAD